MRSSFDFAILSDFGRNPNLELRNTFDLLGRDSLYLLYPSSFFYKCEEQNPRPRIWIIKKLIFVFHEVCLWGGPKPKVDSLTHCVSLWWIRRQCPWWATRGKTSFFHPWVFRWLSRHWEPDLNLHLFSCSCLRQLYTEKGNFIVGKKKIQTLLIPGRPDQHSQVLGKVHFCNAEVNPAGPSVPFLREASFAISALSSLSGTVSWARGMGVFPPYEQQVAV